MSVEKLAKCPPNEEYDKFCTIKNKFYIHPSMHFDILPCSRRFARKHVWAPIMKHCYGWACCQIYLFIFNLPVFIPLYAFGDLWKVPIASSAHVGSILMMTIGSIDQPLSELNECGVASLCTLLSTHLHVRKGPRWIPVSTHLIPISKGLHAYWCTCTKLVHTRADLIGLNRALLMCAECVVSWDRLTSIVGGHETQTIICHFMSCVLLNIPKLTPESSLTEVAILPSTIWHAEMRTKAKNLHHWNPLF